MNGSELHVAFMTVLSRRPREADGVEGKVYDAIVGLRFEYTSRLTYIAVQDRSIFRVAHQLDPATKGSDQQ